jgi:hypothetical protein
MWREKTPWFGIAAAVFVAAPLLAYSSIYWANHTLDANSQIDRFNNTVLKQGQALSADWETKVETAGQPDRNRAMNYQSLRQGRGVQNTLIADIANALPAVPATMLSGDKTKMPPRDQRPIIRIDRLAMDYHDDMTPIVTMDPEAFRQQSTVAGITVPQNANGGGQIGRSSYGAGGGGGGGGGGYVPQGRTPGFSGRNPSPMVAPPPQAAPAAPTAATQRGFVIEIICTTPNANGASFVLAQFVSKLKTLNSSNPDVY